ncbi:Adenylate kinase family protein [Histomonas meleagridis]|uniref:Adenylate kinase family protein n=1 Tax=Histomonas meleagridis TaxID=135588 RepID=UPI00355A6AFF|nr:Adenylate kinase family protein [Histomonas meleagridis]KAH0797901.1 Adenylate kinase family protein [Histomonas meleagridis]
MNIEGKSVIFVLGGPGSGKGTQAIAASKEFKFGYASAGDLLRAEAANPNSQNGKRIAEIINAGQLVPPELLVDTLKNAIISSESQYFLLDGFPRSLLQDDKFREQVGKAAACLMLDAPDEVLIERLRSRGANSGRADDNDNVIPTRIANYKKETLPVLERYQKEGMLETINANQPIEKVYNDFLQVLRKYWNF